MHHGYPGPVEVLFCTSVDNAGGIALVEALLREDLPEGTTGRLLLGDEGRIDRLARKVWHMERGARAATGDVVLNSDSGTRRRGDELQCLVAHLLSDPRLGITWASYTVEGERGLGCLLARLAWAGSAFNFQVANATRLWQGKVPLLAGGLFAMRREVLPAVGHFAATDGFLSEDIELARLVDAAGWRVQLAATRVVRYLDGAPLSDFVERQLRWQVITWTHRDPFRWVSPIAQGGLALVVLTFPLAIAAFPERLVEYGALTVVLVAVRLVAAMALARSTGHRPLSARECSALPLLDLFVLLLAIRAPFVRRIRWRVSHLDVLPDGRVRPTASG